MKRIPPTKLVTPVAMDLEQAKSKLRKTGEWPTKKASKRPKKQDEHSTKKKKTKKTKKETRREGTIRAQSGL